MYNKVYKWFNDWGLFIIAILIIVVYTILNSDISNQQSFNRTVSTNVLFTVINLFSAFYIARKVSLWGWQTETTNNQKKIKKTAIRHNRGNLASILKLIKITKDKVDRVEYTSATFSKDGKFAIISSKNNEINFWNLTKINDY